MYRLDHLFIIVALLPSLHLGLFSGYSSIPWAIVISFFYLFKRRSMELILFIVLTAYSFRFSQEALISLVLLMNALLLPSLFLGKGTKLLKRAFRLFLYLSLLIGIFQLTQIGREFTEFLFGSASGFGTSKGVPLLSYEPGRSAIDVVIISGILYATEKRKHYLVLLIILFFLNKSFTMLLYMGLLTISLINIKQLSYLILLPIPFLILVPDNFRALDLILQLLSSKDAWQLLMIQGGHRIVGLGAVISEFSFFGTGYGNWSLVVSEYMQSIDKLDDIGFYRTNGFIVIPPMSFLGKFYIETGFIGILIISLYMARKFRIVIKNNFRLVGFLLVSSTLIYYPSSPVALLALVYLYNHEYEKSFIYTSKT